MYVTNYLRAHQKKQKQESSKATDPTQNLSPTDVFHQLDGDRDGLLNAFEYEKSLELLGVPITSKRDRKEHALSSRSPRSFRWKSLSARGWS